MRFWKMNGAGNDFIILNNFEEHLPVERLPQIARTLCERRMSIGADGLMVVGRPHMRRRLPDALLQFRRQRRRDVRQRCPLHLPVWVRKTDWRRDPDRGDHGRHRHGAATLR